MRSKGRALFLALFLVVAALLVGVALGIASAITEGGHNALAGAFLGIAGGIGLMLFLFFVSGRPSDRPGAGPGRWIVPLALVVGSVPAWSLLTPSWEATILGFIAGGSASSPCS